MFAQKTAATLLLVPVIGWLFTPALHGQQPTAELKALLKKRLDLANDALKHLPAMIEAGLADVATLLAAERDVLKANLEFYDLPRERIPVLRKLAKLSVDVAKIVEDRKNVGVAKQFEVDMANVVSLDIQIQLLREEQKLAAAEKTPKK